MKLSTGFWQTYKEAPADAEVTSHKLMLRAGLIYKAAAGLYSQLTIGHRVVRKVEQVVREEMDKAGGHELSMTMVTPGQLWQESGRWETMGPEMTRLEDRGGRDLCLSPTNEEPITDIFRKTITSYKQLPITLYQINLKFRDEIRPRFGVMRGREFIMKDAYSFHLDKTCLDKVYAELYQAYENILKRLGLEFIVVEADAGAMADSDSQTHEFQVIADNGEDRIIQCKFCGYAANFEKAATKRSDINAIKTSDKPELVETKNKATIEDVCKFLKAQPQHSLKSMVYSYIEDDEQKFVLCMLLGDDSINDIKLAAAVGGRHHNPATEKELIQQLGMKKGYIGPYELEDNIRVIFDSEISMDGSYIVGANQTHHHFKNVVPKRDCKDFEVASLRNAHAGDLCEKCGKEILERRGIEAGHIFQLGDKYTKSMNTTVLNKEGKAIHPLMGCYGIGVTRLVAAAIEQSHDEAGIIWPMQIAPYHVHFVVIAKSAETKKLADEIYDQLWSAGIEVLMDDRNQGPGHKFKDADLLGLPIRVTLGERDFNQDGTLEIKLRTSNEINKVKKEELLSAIQELKAQIVS